MMVALRSVQWHPAEPTLPSLTPSAAASGVDYVDARVDGATWTWLLRCGACHVVAAPRTAPAAATPPPRTPGETRDAAASGDEKAHGAAARAVYAWLQLPSSLLAPLSDALWLLRVGVDPAFTSHAPSRGDALRDDHDRHRPDGADADASDHGDDDDDNAIDDDDDDDAMREGTATLQLSADWLARQSAATQRRLVPGGITPMTLAAGVQPLPMLDRVVLQMPPDAVRAWRERQQQRASSTSPRPRPLLEIGTVVREGALAPLAVPPLAAAAAVVRCAPGGQGLVGDATDVIVWDIAADARAAPAPAADAAADVAAMLATAQYPLSFLGAAGMGGLAGAAPSLAPEDRVVVCRPRAVPPPAPAAAGGEWACASPRALARWGCFDGQWLVLTHPRDPGHPHRVRVTLVDDADDDDDDDAGTLWVAPLTAWNATPPALRGAWSWPPVLHLVPEPLIAAPAPAPLADVVLTRVRCPATSVRDHDDAVLEALQRWCAQQAAVPPRDGDIAAGGAVLSLHQLIPIPVVLDAVAAPAAGDGEGDADGVIENDAALTAMTTAAAATLASAETIAWFIVSRLGSSSSVSSASSPSPSLSHGRFTASTAVREQGAVASALPPGASLLVPPAVWPLAPPTIHQRVRAVRLLTLQRRLEALVDAEHVAGHGHVAVAAPAAPEIADAALRLGQRLRHPRTAALGAAQHWLVCGPAGSGKRTLLRETAALLGYHWVELDGLAMPEDAAGALAWMAVMAQRVAHLAPCLVTVTHLDACLDPSRQDAPILQHAFLQLCATPAAASGPPAPVAATPASSAAADRPSDPMPVIWSIAAEDVQDVPSAVRSRFHQTFTLGAPDEAERTQIVRDVLSVVPHDASVTPHGLAQIAAGVSRRQLVQWLVTTAQRARDAPPAGSAAAAARSATWPAAVVGHGPRLTYDGAEAVLETFRKARSRALGAPKIPQVQWDDVGGFDGVKQALLDTIRFPLDHPDLFDAGLQKRSGVLLYGPPGTGKTLMAKAVATTFRLNFLSVKGPELLDMYIGESEANVRRVFQRARDARPCIIFFDELDSIAPQRGDKSDAGGVMDRIVSQLLAELDDVAAGGGGQIFVIGATNRPDLLDASLLRPGRFDKMVYLGISTDRQNQAHILRALTKKFQLADDVDLDAIAARCPAHLTGADLYALSSDALLKAVGRTAQHVDAAVAALNAAPAPIEDGYERPISITDYLERIAAPEALRLVVTRADWDAALRELQPSLTPETLAHYEVLRQRYAAPSAPSAEARAMPPEETRQPQTATPNSASGVETDYHDVASTASADHDGSSSPA